MEKKIEDYLHLYLGCEVLFEKCSYHFVHTLNIHRGEKYPLNKEILFELSVASGVIIKPILRPLSDMTEGEYSELNKLFQKHDHARDMSMIEQEAERTLFMLKNGFDLFGLIEAGLAIDKTNP